MPSFLARAFALVFIAALCAAPAFAQPGTLPACCNMTTGEFVGEMSPEDCLLEENHIPDITAYAQQILACRSPIQSGPDVWGGGDPEEAFEDNLINGNFESWSGRKPRGFGTYSTEPGDALVFETVSQSPDSYTGGSSVRVENVEPNIPNIPAGMVEIVLPGGMITCDNCPIITRREAIGGGDLPRSMRFPVSEPQPFVCGAYKGDMNGGDKAVLSVVVLQGGEVIGGTGWANQSYIALSDLPGVSATEWTEFKLPIMFPRGRPDGLFREAAIQASIMPGAIVGGGAIPDIDPESIRNNPAAAAAAAAAIASTVGAAASVHAGSYVLLDSVHLCGSQTTLDLHLPEYVEEGRLVREREKLLIGGLVWQNIDNDDLDATFDHEDTDDTSFENDLAELVLRFPEREIHLPLVREPQEGRLHIEGDATRIKIWHDRNRTHSFDDLDDWIPLPDLLTEVDGDDKVGRLWIEGLEPSTSLRDVVIEFTIRDPQLPQEEDTDRVAMTVLAIDNMEWIGQRNSEHDDNDLGEDPNFPEDADGDGVRVFPGSRWEGSGPGDKRDKVTLKVTLNVEPPVPVALRFRAFDVDDPGDHGNDIDWEEEDEDNRTEAGPPTGLFTESESDLLTTTFDAREKELEFQVPMQPGDNVRVAGFVYAEGRDYIERQLHNDDTRLSDGGARSAGTEIVDADIWDRTSNHEQANFDDNHLSDVLTVWRYFYTEVDGMEPVRLNSVYGTIVSVSPVGDGPGTSVTVNVNLSEATGSRVGPSGQLEMFAGGTLTVTGYGEYPVIANTAFALGVNDIVYTIQDVPESAEGSEFELQDDDQWHAFGNGDPIPMPDLSRLEPVFEEAFIVPRFDVLPNGRATVPYVANAFYETAADLTSTYYFDNEEEEANEDFWVVYIRAAHQGANVEDGDGVILGSQAPEQIISGIIDNDGWGANIFMEGIYERNEGNVQATTRSGLGAADTVAHEVAHLFGAEHDEAGLMDQISALLSATSLDRVRRARHP